METPSPSGGDVLDRDRAPHGGPVPAFRTLLTERSLYLSVVLIFAASVFLTWHFTFSMAGGMSMPGGWTMSMMWMVMPGQTWATAAVLFLLMWEGMMIAMMLPSAWPMLLLYRRAVQFRRKASGQGGSVGWATWMLAAGYFTVWLAFGAGAYGLGMGLSWAAMKWGSVSRMIPLLSGMALAVSGVYQWTPWKSACLQHCRDPLSDVASHLQDGWQGGWRLGLHHGAFCAGCCWALMVIQLVLGVMNLPLMAAIAVVIALEKLTPRGEWIAKAIGGAAVLGGVMVAAKALF